MVLEDLQQIISESSHRATGKRTLLLLSGTALLIALAVVGLLIGVIYLGASRNTSSHGFPAGYVAAIKGARDICVTPKCLHASAWYLDIMDFTVNPCEDFFNYACGKWRKNIYPPPNYGKFTLKDEIHLKNEEKWRAIMESRIKRNTEISYERKMKEFFKMCIHDYGKMKDAGLAMLDIVQNHLGGWYVLDPDNWHANWNMNDALRKLHSEYQVDAVFEYGIWPDMKNARRNILSVSNSYFMLCRFSIVNISHSQQ